MKKKIPLVLKPDQAFISKKLIKAACQKGNMSSHDLTGFRILKRSIDARKPRITVHVLVELTWDEPATPIVTDPPIYKDVTHSPEIVVVGCGPAGIFASLRLLERGFKPIIIERGLSVSKRKKDVALLNRHGTLDPESNYCYGEGGAGTFSDGKLYTRATKSGDVNRILEVFYQHGAAENILFENHPHIGTDRLPAIMTTLRETLLAHGAEVHFGKQVNGLIKRKGLVNGVTTSKGDRFEGRAVILATGHSARDIYYLLSQSGAILETKGFAMGIRIEHPQALIDCIQYHSCDGRGQFLPPAEYRLKSTIADRGVFSFCMCPGGTIVPSMTSPNETVINGMSNSTRSSPFANSGLVVEIRPEDLGNWSSHGALAGLKYQGELEQLARNYGDPNQVAPAQRISDFVRSKDSATLPNYSYHPGLVPSPLYQWLPDSIRTRLQEAIRVFGKRMKGFDTSEGIVVGVESRTSSPVRVRRVPDTLMQTELPGLFPAGEGAGFAGGIMSSALDGRKSADAVVKWISA